MKELLQTLISALAKPVPVDLPHVQGIALPPGWSFDEERDPRAAPERINTTVTLSGIPSFVEYVNRFKTGPSTIFVSPDLSKLSNNMTLATAYLEYHDPIAPEPEPAFLTHKALLTARPHLIYSKLLQLDGRLMPQSDFAQELEDIARFSSSHAAADLLEVARTINLTSKGAFKSFEDDFSGSTEFRYDLQVQANAGAVERKLVVPSTIQFRAPLIEGLSEEMVEVKFLYRIPRNAGDAVQLGIKIMDRAYIEEKAIAEAVDKIAGLTSLPVYIGSLTNDNAL